MFFCLDKTVQRRRGAWASISLTLIVRTPMKQKIRRIQRLREREREREREKKREKERESLKNITVSKRERQ